MRADFPKVPRLPDKVSDSPHPKPHDLLTVPRDVARSRLLQTNRAQSRYTQVGYHLSRNETRSHFPRGEFRKQHSIVNTRICSGYCQDVADGDGLRPQRVEHGRAAEIDTFHRGLFSGSVSGEPDMPVYG